MEGTEHERWIRRAVAYIERHLTDDVNFDDVARHTAVSRFHLHRVFQRQLGYSAAFYLRERRLARAAADLLRTNKRILDIALEYRFAGQDSFTRAFKRAYGMTPHQYRSGFRIFHRTEERLTLSDVFHDDAQPSNPLRAPQTAPPGWLITGLYPHEYTAGIDRVQVHRGKASGTLRGDAAAKPDGFGTLMQMFDAGQYRGRRIRLNGFMKSEQVKKHAGMWMRVDGPEELVLAFDNMTARPIQGTTGWALYTIVLDVSEQAEAIAFGVLLSGPGQIWIDGLRFEEVDETVPVTDMLPDMGQSLPAAPVNLDFEAELSAPGQE
ncbi:helix-turn-helix transcriptional regulator [Paenibacillus dendritiformis]|uniref:AraC family transcriptional regulator n=1 Tax=Paenibacillus dendritiformis C454 TaxID=1131935 RepID=H3SLT6_9BACL|nr:AraC family transcriptional regulator [Paenibacillus dendritiformis]EHQ59967.1 AraC family transcriptional regulator [Paenibacillus dendritiformis C454]CAH8768008.1 AraC family transcriptional regulator [Paenibacillus dendritiformis]